jgi:chromosome segregation ATPase
MDTQGSVTIPRAMPKVKSDSKLGDSDAELAQLSQKKDILKSAADDLHLQIAKIEEGIIRRTEILKKEAQAIKAASEQKEQQAGVTAKLDLRQQKKEEYLKEFEQKLRKEQQMMSIARQQLNTDKQRHQCVMLSAMGGLKEKVNRERQEFLNAVVAEVDGFKLPSADSLFGTQNEDMIKELKTLCAELNTGL